MNKKKAYTIAALVCLAYLVLFVLILTLLGINIKQLGTFWKVLFLALPIFELWRRITSQAKKDNDLSQSEDSTEDNFEKK